MVFFMLTNRQELNLSPYQRLPCGILLTPSLTKSQSAHKQRKMDDFFVAGFLKTEESLYVKTSEMYSSRTIGLADADKCIILDRLGVQTKVYQVVDGSLLETDLEPAVLIVCIKDEVGCSLEIVFPAEMVGVIVLFKPVGRLSPDLCLKRSDAKVFVLGAKILTPLGIGIEVADLVA